ncbi:DUF2239 family protein [Variovorax soli]|uniref:DUF2239 domain-containing protein n=1 Tax=Variovorax soli TaxID=376815 RepID=A0ABU1NIY9_9BURK|nr:DUF2239 family protein [Variovorax soli]MDR6537826.1 hypothetical protein [Variovorax soli]
MSSSESTLTAFAGVKRLATGSRAELVAQLRASPHAEPVFIFDDSTGEPIDLDLREGAGAPAADAADEHASRGVGRPKLGVVAREVTLLPRHWDWLSRQPGGASVALRRLIDEARRVHADRDAQRASREAAYRFMSAIAGDLPGFEDTARALFANERARFEELIGSWPGDVSAYLRQLAAAAWSAA